MCVHNAEGSENSLTVTLTVISTPNIYSFSRNSSGNVILGLADAPNSTNFLWATTNLSPPINWQLVISNVFGTNGLFPFTDSNAVGNKMRFYRLSTP